MNDDTGLFLNRKPLFPNTDRNSDKSIFALCRICTANSMKCTDMVRKCTNHHNAIAHNALPDYTTVFFHVEENTIYYPNYRYRVVEGICN